MSDQTQVADAEKVARQRVHKYAHTFSAEQKEKLENYKAWATDYNTDVTALQYTAPKHCVDLILNAVNKHSEISMNSSVVDFCCGTGLVANRLRSVGFTGPIDGVDGSDAMLDLTAGVYRNTFCQFLDPGKNLPEMLSSSQYDVAVMAGGFGPAQVDAGCLKHLIHSIKIGGVCIFSTRTNRCNSEFSKKLDDELTKYVHCDVIVIDELRNIDKFELSSFPEEMKETRYIPGVAYCLLKLKPIKE
ncbi:methyltransferase-like protein 27 [Ciona intestinalis]